MDLQSVEVDTIHSVEKLQVVYYYVHRHHCSDSPYRCFRLPSAQLPGMVRLQPLELKLSHGSRLWL